jgi:DNA invertase Pin-like site-specific DNA recombinase
MPEGPKIKGLACCKSLVQNEVMKYGYARVSTDDRTTALQRAALTRAGCKTIFKDEGISGATTKRPALLRCLKKLEHGDTLMVWKLDRLGRSLRDLITMLDDLKKRGVKFRSLTEAIDTETPTGRGMWQMIGVLAELERSLISERTRAGVKDAQRRGVKFGRKPKLTALQIELARKQIERGEDRGNVAESFKVNRTTLYRALAG